MPKLAYEVLHPDRNTSCVVFASPHSGRDYPWRFLRTTVLNEHQVRSSEDAFVDKLFDCAPRFGASFLKAGAPRAFVDLNRAVDELDPALIEGVRPKGHNPRVASGLGVVPRVVANGRAIYRGKLSLAEAERRIDLYWRPYHTMLQQLLDSAHRRHGQAILIDCHSMPHEAMDSVVRGGMKRPDVVLGDRFGAAAAGEVVDRIEAAFVAAGFVVTRNAPFAGAYITQAYGRPARGQHAVQVEIDRSLYMNEALVRPNGGFDDIRARLAAVVADVAQIGQGRMPLAAE
ncbi:N-formylglutamate amidohydrolase [Sulfitobacter pseudonitzschiae]|uniref:N-formylglutamate amidohydrolase n=1 Tax=Pseudosulfitobacter pseudonitzschiae TaxID=1402135 RepID=A0A9Q2NIT8_9RHOB|nr:MULTISPECIES: N-formylglutamate amidohydrolase [Roseobacteraceae]MBM2290290.1 N-formylglutamate amidohydrolase [Pseudosulfitobacter pseudonitzschiae]MBM2295208.1 N-formylglutamate amidohydrolase [Pseudosulfitobacter pseudonitzschiae]MBM2300120.1 N-formylglutamate amidohydrolase [Pseudosulfitobacter pseudonitzschiae]MBM2309905.1 N-formylglutamate amidohydrolase [Pseudosulfitobacter pseudonitzschiae]MBM2314817.1 N-formylglutamate amidohydrolase [Pseudosulfitobacter pseudonitzschiae]|tara:strand:- start:16928 stop:17788 length:861 start_codon:yes stop_codon:yes gene_type:complete